MSILTNIDIKKIVKPGIFCLVFFAVDRILKVLSLHGKIFFYKNYGLAFSWPIIEIFWNFVLLLSGLVFIIIIWQLIKNFKSNSFILSFGYWLFALGLASNLLDRLKFGFIIDYFNFYFFYNNLADIILVVGLLLIGYQNLKTKNFLE